MPEPEVANYIAQPCGRCDGPHPVVLRTFCRDCGLMTDVVCQKCADELDKLNAGRPAPPHKITASLSFNSFNEQKTTAFVAAGDPYNYVVLRSGPLDISLSSENAIRLGHQLMQAGVKGFHCASDADRILQLLQPKPGIAGS